MQSVPVREIARQHFRWDVQFREYMLIYAHARDTRGSGHFHLLISCYPVKSSDEAAYFKKNDPSWPGAICYADAFYCSFWSVYTLDCR